MGLRFSLESPLLLCRLTKLDATYALLIRALTDIIDTPYYSPEVYSSLDCSP